MKTPSWPTGHRTAVVFNVMYEQWADGVAPALGPMGNPLPVGALDYQAISWARYGRRAGIWNLLRLLADYQVRASVYASGILAISTPESLRAIVAAGHELNGHSYSQDIIPATLSTASEREDIARSLEELERCTGTRPTGWISPRCTPSAMTAQLLTEQGLSWYGDVFDDDLPYLEATPAGEIVALPFSMEVNDLPMSIRYGEPWRELALTFIDALAEHRQLPHRSFIDVTVHAHLAGRPVGLGALRQILEHVADQDDLWVATRAEIAACITA